MTRDNLYDRLTALNSAQLRFVVNKLVLDERFIAGTTAPSATVASDVYSQVQQRGPDMVDRCHRILDAMSSGSEALDWRRDSVGLRKAAAFLLVRRNVFLIVGILVLVAVWAIAPEGLLSQRRYVVAAFAALVIWTVYSNLQRALTHGSQIQSSEVLHRVIDQKGGFFGRSGDTEKIATLCEQAPLTVVIGESGVGKSALLRWGLPSALQERKSVDYLYVERCGEEWDEGPCHAIARALSQSLIPVLERQITVAPKPGIAELSRLIEDIYDLHHRTLVIALDAFDEYIREFRPDSLTKILMLGCRHALC